MSEPHYRLLIVAAGPEEREWYRRALSAGDGASFECIEANSGHEGLDRCRKHRPDCVLLDDQLPDMNAKEFLDALGREAPAAVVVLTEPKSESIAIKTMQAGAHDYLTKRAPAAEVRRVVRSAMERQARPAERTYRVLIIDDSPEDRLTYRRRLSAGPDRFEFREAETGRQGLEAYREFLPDCILLDYQLPDGDGLEVLSNLLVEEQGHDVAVLILTGQGNESIAVQALKAGAEDYLVKGPALAGLPQTVRAALEKVSLRRQLEQQRLELERHRNELRVTLASIGDAVIATDLAGNVTFLNPIAESLTGWPAQDARGRPLNEVFVIVNEETRQPVDNPALRALRDGVVVGLANHTILLGRDGRERPIDDSAAPIRNDNGEVFGAVLVFRDVSARRSTEQSLLLQSRVLDSMTEGVSVADEKGVIFYTNPAEDRMFGYGRGELLGQRVTVQNSYPPDENERRVNEVIKQLTTGGTWAGEWHNRRKDGTNFISYARITALEIAGRRCFVCVQEDITDRKRLEDDLQQRVADLALADKRKDEFLAMLAHELRNPLAPVKNSVSLLRLVQRDWDTVDQVRDILERQVGHLVRLVDDLLDVSRITQGKVTLKLERLDLAQLVRFCTADHQHRFETAGIALSVETPQTPVWVNGDPTRLTQVMDNFLTNSLKFTNPGGRVSVSLQCEAGRVTLSVRDTGIGIEPDVLPTIFTVFSQSDKSLDRSRGGLGLGLAIVKGLVELHGGTVTAASRGLGTGTEMSIALPIAGEAPPLARPLAPRRGEITRRRVLIIEDNRDSAESLRMLLAAVGYEVQLVHTGLEGVRVATEWQPNAVVCDIGLPEMDGFAVARRLREAEANHAIRLIALTGYGREEDVVNACAAGFDDYLVKPADPEKLLEMLKATDFTN